MPNPNELARLAEELAEAKTHANDLHISKAGRRHYVAQLRDLERQLGLPHEDIVHPTRQEWPVPKQAMTQGRTVTLTSEERAIIVGALCGPHNLEDSEARVALVNRLI